MIYPLPFAVALVTTLLLSPFYVDISLLVGVGLFAVVYVTVDLERQLRSDPIALGPLMFIIGCLQLIIAPWLTQYFPHSNPAYQIPKEAFATYLAYVVPLCLAVGLGLVVARAFFPRVGRGMPGLWLLNLDPITERAILKLFWAAFGLMVVAPWLPVPGALAFFVLLLGEIAWVCPLMLLLGRRPYWWKLALLVLGWSFAASIGAAMFHSFLLWLLFYVMVYWAIRFRGRGFKYVLLGGLLFVFIFQPAKVYFRTQGGGVSGFGTVLLNYVTHPERAYTPEVLAETLMRMNQGWIVHRVMVWVPSHEPYAGLSMLTRQGIGVLLPRFILPNKYEAGGREHFERYTGHQLFNASMGLGYAGEFYAAFGWLGGILAGFLYGLLFGAAFERLKQAARANPLWWAWGPFIFLVAIKAEDAVGHAVNWAVKAFVVVLLVRYQLARIFRRRLPARPPPMPVGWNQTPPP